MNMTLGKQRHMEQNYCWKLGEKDGRLCSYLTKRQESYNDVVYEVAHMVLSDGDFHLLPLCSYFPLTLWLEGSLPHGK